jgi:tetratricopeptide (TPR) repeat protein
LIAWLAYLIILVPMLGLMEHPHVANDRYSYLPAIAISICISGLLQVYGRMRMAFIAGAVWSVFLGASAICQARVWRNSETLFKHMIVGLNNHPYREHIHLRLGIYFETQGRTREAVEQYKLCLTIEPSEVKVLTKLAVLLTMCEEQDVRNGPEAVAYAQQACELTSHSDPQKLTVLASALAESGRGSEAIAILLKAQELARAQGNEGFVASSSKLMEFYRAGKTARDYMASTK